MRPSRDEDRDVVIVEEPADSEAVRWCFSQYYAELDRRFEGGFDVDEALPLGLDELSPPHGLVLLARMVGEPVGCGALKLTDPRAGEVKRMWVSERVRGRGVGGRLLAELEARARNAGKLVTRLETNRSLSEAIAMYRRRGYREVAPFNDERYGDHWFEKDLSPAPPPPAEASATTRAMDLGSAEDPGKHRSSTSASPSRRRDTAS